MMLRLCRKWVILSLLILAVSVVNSSDVGADHWLTCEQWEDGCDDVAGCHAVYPGGNDGIDDCYEVWEVSCECPWGPSGSTYCGWHAGYDYWPMCVWA
jgi:hypothetical protein